MLRVIAGSAGGIRLKSVPGDTTRPILDRVKAALFDILRSRLEGLHILDLFAGSGSVGIEALSQGASHCVFLDIAPAAIKVIKENLETTGLADQAEIRKTDAFRYIRQTTKSFDLIYVAPPQFKALWIDAMHHIAERPELVRDNGEIVVQIDPKEYELLELTEFEEVRQKKYGNTLLVFYEKVTEASS